MRVKIRKKTATIELTSQVEVESFQVMIERYMNMIWEPAEQNKDGDIDQDDGDSMAEELDDAFNSEDET